MLSVSRFAIHHPRRILLAASLLVVVIAPGMARLKLRTDGQALLPVDAPEVVQDRAIRRDFGLADSLIVLIRSTAPEGIYNAQTIRLLEEVTRRLQQLEGLRGEGVISLATEKGHRVRPGTLQFLGLLDPLPQTAAQLTELRADVKRLQVYDGTLISKDEKATAIYIDVPEGVDRLVLCSRVQQILDGLADKGDEIHITGAPVAESLLGIHILEDLGAPLSRLGAEFAWSADEVRGPAGGFDNVRLWLARHVGLLPLAIGVMTIVFLVAFRSATAAAFTWVKVVCCLAMVFGLMGWCGVPIYLTTAVIPVILTAIGVSDEVHIFNRYARNLVQCGPVHPSVDPSDPRGRARTAMLAAMTEVWRPVTMTSVTTAFGFLSFVLSPLAPVRAFGLFTALGAMVCMAWALTATPALAVLVDPRRFARKAEKLEEESPVASRSATLQTGAMAIMGRIVIADRSGVVLLFVALLIVAAVGIRRIAIQDSWIDGFSPSTRFYQSTQLFNDQFLGMHALYVCVDTGSGRLAGVLDESEIDHQVIKLPGDLVSAPETLKGQMIELRRTTPSPAMSRPVAEIPYQSRIVSAAREGDKVTLILEKLKGSPRFRLYLSPGDSVHFVLTPRRLALPDTLRVLREFEQFLAAHPGEQVGGALGPSSYLETTHYISQARREGSRRIPNDADSVTLLWNSYGRIRGTDRLRAAVDPDLARAIISVYLKNANFRDTQRLLDDVRRYQRDTLASRGIDVSFAGDVAASQAMIRAITHTQISSIALSILGVFASAVLVHRSVKWGMLCALPCALATPLTFGLMGFASIPLGVATSMFAAMAIGIGDDYAIHFVERYRMALANGASTSHGIVETLSAAGPSIVVDALSVSLGFAVLTLSQVPANARLGVMIVAGIVTCLAATLLLLPAVCSWLRGPDGLRT